MEAILAVTRMAIDRPVIDGLTCWLPHRQRRHSQQHMIPKTPFLRRAATGCMLIVLVSWLPVPVVNAQSGEPSTRDFFRHEQFTSVRISPAGKYLAVSVPREGKTWLAVIEIASNEVVATLDGGPDEHVYRFEWVNNERVIVSTTRKLGSFDQPLVTPNLFAINADGSEPIQLLGGYRPYWIVDSLRDDPEHILIQVYNHGRYHDVYRMNVYTGRTKTAVINPVREGIVQADLNGVPRLAIGRSEKAETIVKYRPDAEKAGWREIERFAPGKGGMRPLAFAPDNQKVLVASDREQPTTAISLLDPASGSLNPLLVDAQYDITNEAGAIAGYNYLLMARDNRTPIGVSYEQSRQQVSFFDATHPDAGVYQKLLAAFPGQRLKFGNFTDDGKKLVLRAESDRNPGAFYLYELDKNQVTWLLDARPWIDPERMRPMQPVSFKARDGQDLTGYLTLPRGSGKNLPLIVRPQGGPHGLRDYWGWDDEVQFFSAHGYAVLQVNFRGSGGYGREFQAAGYRKWGREMQDDLTDATRWAVALGYADDRRMCIYGGSYGGYAALMGVIREPQLYQCAVGYVGAYDISLMFDKADYLEADKKAFRKTMQLYHGTDEKDWEARSPIYQVDKIKAGLFVVAGKKDTRVPFEHFEELTAALDEAGKPYESLVKPLEGHGFYSEDNRVELYDRMLAFFDKRIGAPAAVVP